MLLLLEVLHTHLGVILKGFDPNVGVTHCDFYAGHVMFLLFCFLLHVEILAKILGANLRIVYKFV